MSKIRFARFSMIVWLLAGVASAQDEPVVGEVKPGRVVVPYPFGRTILAGRGSLAPGPHLTRYRGILSRA
jgi:hypothetical protein